jgi:hypothetical protein
MFVSTNLNGRAKPMIRLHTKKERKRREEKGDEEKEEGRRRRRKKGRRLVDNNQRIIKNGYLYQICLKVLMVKKIQILKKL